MDVTPLTVDFPAASHERWAALVERTLKGATADSLTYRSFDDVSTQALYVQSPAESVVVRSALPIAREHGRWDLRTIVSHPDPVTAGAQGLQDLENGASSLLLRLDPAGENGIAVAAAADLATVLTGVEIELAPIALDAGFLGVEAAGWLHAVAKSAPRAKLAFHLDPLSAFAQAGVCPGPLEGHVSRAARLAVELQETYLDATAFLASGAVAHEAGASEAQELAVMLSAALSYVRALDEAGLDPAAALRLITLGICADAEYFVTLAKLRAARTLWSRLASAFGSSQSARLEARSSRRMMSRLDPWVNLLRLTAAGFGAAVGGADIIVLEPFTQPLGRPTDFARRQARNAQLVLMEECALGRVADPAGGAWFLESQTDQLARAAWSLFQAIEAAGGLAKALRLGLIQEWVEGARNALATDLASGARQLIGVTTFRNPDEASVAVDTVDPKRFAKASPRVAAPGRDDTCAPLRPWRAAEAFEATSGAVS